jgi:hypothetical protein
VCTVTVIPLPQDQAAPSVGFRLVTNRDESRMRPPAEPPGERSVAGVRVCWPTDPSAGGTWVGVSDLGLALTVLNLNPVTPPDLPPADALRSRGLLIPDLAALPSAPAVADALESMAMMRFAPFRLLAVDNAGVIEARWDRDALTIARHPMAPLCFVSSGMGDHLVEPRLGLFAQWIGEGPMTPERQDAYHAHRWPSRPDISVRMERDAARTVSTTAVTVRSHRGAWRWDMRYMPVGPVSTPETHVLRRVPAAAQAAQ